MNEWGAQQFQYRAVIEAIVVRTSARSVGDGGVVEALILRLWAGLLLL
jgi:hypothetical protein